MESQRLERVLISLKSEFLDTGELWKENRESNHLEELHALVGAINEVEVFLYGKRITTLLDIV